MDITLASNMREWIKEGKNRGANCLIIVHDEEYDCDSPIFVYPEQDIEQEVAKAMKLGMVVAISTLGRGVEELIPPNAPMLVSRVEH